MRPSARRQANPIEQVFAKLEALPCKVAARTREALWSAVGCLPEGYTPEECRNYPTDRGYEPA
jgi:hypothetical protein